MGRDIIQFKTHGTSSSKSETLMTPKRKNGLMLGLKKQSFRISYIIVIKDKWREINPNMFWESRVQPIK